MKKLTLSLVIEQLKANVVMAKTQDYVRKPFSWALYRTWKWADGIEKENEE